MNSFIRQINGFFKNNIFYPDTDSLYKKRIYWDVLDKANLVGGSLYQGKNDLQSGSLFYGLYLAPKI